MYRTQLFMEIHYSPIPLCFFIVYLFKSVPAGSCSCMLTHCQVHCQKHSNTYSNISIALQLFPEDDLGFQDIYQTCNKTKRGKNDTATVCNDLFVKVVWFELANYRQALCPCYGNRKHLLPRAPCQFLPCSKLMLPISPVLLCIHHRTFTVWALNSTNPYSGNYEKCMS